MENKLVTVEKVTEVLPIEKADKIENIKLGEWSVVSQKNQYKVGDLVIMIRPDAILPYDLIEKYQVREFLKKGARVRVVRLKGCYSECLLLPINELEDSHLCQEGEEVSEVLGIEKYEEPERVQSNEPSIPKVYFQWKKIYSFKMWKSYLNYLFHQRKKKKLNANPNFFKYHKFENKKNVKIFKEGDPVVITEKIHGTNFRCGLVRKTNFTLKEKIKRFFRLPVNEFEFLYGSHNVQLTGSSKKGYYDTNVYLEAVGKYNLESLLKELHELYEGDVIIYGEVYGPTIQKGYEYGLTERKLAIFDIQIDGEYVENDIFNLLCKRLDLPTVPFLYDGPYSEEVCQKYTTEVSVIDNKTVREGCVVKCPSGNRHRIFKSINPEYKIKQDKENLTDFH
jgi:hypothetical protein